MDTPFCENQVRKDEKNRNSNNKIEKSDINNDQEVMAEIQPAFMRVKKILLAIDKSGYKIKAMSFAITLAKALGAGVTAIHVIDKSTLKAAVDVVGYYRGGKVEEYQDAYERKLKKQAEELLGEVKMLGDKEGVKTYTEVLLHAPSISKAIIDYAKNNKMDIIVIGTKGMTGIAKFLIGNVANTVAAHAPCAVLLVR
jgi:nucleotide-binding universal stress UspA family protein